MFCHLEDSLELTLSDMNKKNLFNNVVDLICFLREEAESNLLTEICGLVGIDENNQFVYEFMQNRSKNPEIYFSIDPYDYLCFLKKYNLLFIFHTHLCGDESPSEFDIKTSENCCYPFLIYSICSEKFSIYEPKHKSYDVNIIEKVKGRL